MSKRDDGCKGRREPDSRRLTLSWRKVSSVPGNGSNEADLGNYNDIISDRRLSRKSEAEFPILEGESCLGFLSRNKGDLDHL